MTTDPDLWVMILAGGDGLRLRDCPAPDGDASIPKQFRHFHGKRSLVRVTLQRARRLTSPDRILLIVTEHHRRYWEEELREHPYENALCQPSNCGTGVGILLGVVHALLRSSDPVLVVLPSDHDVEGEAVLLGGIRAGAEEARKWEENIIVLGTVPQEPDCEYGYIVPGETRGRSASVEAFVEKPPREEAELLMARGACWNSFILAARGATLLDLYQRVRPELLSRFLGRLADLNPGSRSLEKLYEGLPHCDFGRDLLMAATHRLRVIPVEPCGWTDLGTPDRVGAWLQRKKVAAPAAGVTRRS